MTPEIIKRPHPACRPHFCFHLFPSLSCIPFSLPAIIVHDFFQVKNMTFCIKRVIYEHPRLRRNQLASLLYAKNKQATILKNLFPTASVPLQGKRNPHTQAYDYVFAHDRIRCNESENRRFFRSSRNAFHPVPA